MKIKTKLLLSVAMLFVMGFALLVGIAEVMQEKRGTIIALAGFFVISAIVTIVTIWRAEI